MNQTRYTSDLINDLKGVGEKIWSFSVLSTQKKETDKKQKDRVTNKCSERERLCSVFLLKMLKSDKELCMKIKIGNEIWNGKLRVVTGLSKCKNP